MRVLRLFTRMLDLERRDIGYIYLYAFFTGIVGLALPLLIQLFIKQVSNGWMTTSLYVLLGVVAVLFLLNGGMQIVQIQLVEYLQRRIFARAALGLSIRIPRIEWQSVRDYYPPELINRFFDVINIQKGLTILLTDTSVALFQMFFGIILLAIYHPFFAGFSLIAMVIFVAYFALTFGKGLESSIQESKEKYKVAHWLEELGRSFKTFKLSGESDFATQRSGELVDSYLDRRSVHYDVLVKQYWAIILFKVFLVVGLLVLGSSLVITQRINFGQFVAAEILIILILSSLEKLLLKIDSFYDLLTSVEKVNSLDELPLEEFSEGIGEPFEHGEGLAIELKEFGLVDPYCGKTPMSDLLEMRIDPGKAVCITGQNNHAKLIFARILLGMNSNFNGDLFINDFTLRELNLDDYRRRIGSNLADENIFHGSLLENITMQGADVRRDCLQYATRMSGLDRLLKQLNDGYQTQLISEGLNVPERIRMAVILARALYKRPGLLLINTDSLSESPAEQESIIRALIEENNRCSTIFFSQDDWLSNLADQTIDLSHTNLNRQLVAAI